MMMPPYISISVTPILKLQHLVVRSIAVLVVLRLSEREWHVSVLDHMLDLSPHYSALASIPLSHSSRKLTGQRKQNEPVNYQNRPENRYIENREPGAEKPNSNSSRSRIPELEFRKTANERSEFLVLFCGQATRSTVFHLIVYSLI